MVGTQDAHVDLMTDLLTGGINIRCIQILLPKGHVMKGHELQGNILNKQEPLTAADPNERNDLQGNTSSCLQMPRASWASGGLRGNPTGPLLSSRS